MPSRQASQKLVTSVSFALWKSIVESFLRMETGWCVAARPSVALLHCCVVLYFFPSPTLGNLQQCSQTIVPMTVQRRGCLSYVTWKEFTFLALVKQQINSLNDKFFVIYLTYNEKKKSINENESYTLDIRRTRHTRTKAEKDILTH